MASCSSSPLSSADSNLSSPPISRKRSVTQATPGSASRATASPTSKRQKAAPPQSPPAPPKSTHKPASRRGKDPKSTPPPPPDPHPPSTRPSRTRKAPERLSDLAPAPAPLKKLDKPNRRANWDPSHLVTHPKSALLKANLKSLLLSPAAWDVLTPDEQAQLLSMLPSTPIHATAAAKAAAGERVRRPSCLGVGHTSFVSDVAKWREDLESGFLEKSWLGRGEEAMRLRREGVFDEWKEREVEAFWGQRKK